MSDGEMTYEDWLRGCVHHDGRHGYVTLPCDEVLKIADFIERLRADRNTEPNSSENPNNCETCGTPRHLCEYCIEENRIWTPKTEPQLTAKCLNCANGGSYKCTKCDGEMYFKTEPQTERSE